MLQPVATTTQINTKHTTQSKILSKQQGLGQQTKYNTVHTKRSLYIHYSKVKLDL